MGESLEARVAELEAELAEARAALKRRDHTRRWEVMDHAPLAIQAFDVDGLATYLNHAMVRFLGFSDPSASTGRFNVLTDPFMKAAGQLPAFQRAYAGELVVIPDFEIDLAAAGSRWPVKGRTAWFEQVIVPLKNDSGELIEVVSFIRDVSERKTLEEAMLSAQRRDGMARISRAVAHDFHNLLTGILGNASMGLEADDLAASHEFFENINSAAEQAARITGQLMTYAGGGSGVRDVVDLAMVAQDMRAFLRASVASNITLDASLSEAWVQADSAQLRQVILNLVSNAAQAISDDGGRVALSTAVSDGGAPAVVLRVEDDGPGMSETVKARIFEPFFTTRADGHGLGLAAVLNIVEAHGGELSVETREGGGAAFEIRLPAVAPPS